MFIIHTHRHTHRHTHTDTHTYTHTQTHTHIHTQTHTYTHTDRHTHTYTHTDTHTHIHTQTYTHIHTHRHTHTHALYARTIAEPHDKFQCAVLSCNFILLSLPSVNISIRLSTRRPSQPETEECACFCMKKLYTYVIRTPSLIRTSAASTTPWQLDFLGTTGKSLNRRTPINEAF